MLFYPTSPVHVREIRRVAEKLSGWRIQGVTYEPLAQIAPGIAQALSDQDIPAIGLAEGQAPGTALPSDVSILVLGAVFEPFALELLSWAKMQNTPVAAIEEVAQLGLNDEDICNYDAPFDRLFVASPDELEHFLALGYPREMLQVSGLPAYERIAALSAAEEAAALEHLGIRDGRKTILYTTSPLRSRRAIHNKDTPKFRDAMLRALATTRELTQRRIVVKLHPNEDLATERTFILERIPDAIVVGRELTMETLFAAAAVVVNRGNSQTCMEAVLRGIPTVIAACGLHTLFHDSDVARIVGSTDAITNAVIDAIAGTSSATAAFRARHCVLPESGVSAFIARELKMLTERQVRATPESWRWLIKSMLFMGRHARALELLRDLTSRDAWTNATLQALDAHFAGQRAAAKQHWQACRAIDPTWFMPDYELAHNCLAEGSYESAMAHAHKAIALHPPFHSLWHEIPMRVVVMAALRGLGRDTEAATELAALDRRELVAIVPELLIEKSALAIRQSGEVGHALDMIERAVQVLTKFPVSPDLDRDLVRRALVQAHHIGDQADHVLSLPAAAACHARLAKAFPDDAWILFALARTQLRKGNWVSGVRKLIAITAIPEGPREIAIRVLPPEAAVALLPLWPGVPGIHPRPWTLLQRTFTWGLRGWHASSELDRAQALSFTLLVAVFVPRHVMHQLLIRRPVIP
jgi:tetratricopeptide (TPR) repeat protein